ncbi:hypothetical protein HMPREF1986_00485 [Oribacterium sp. oral taxon 078 str. F0263]|nr:hypothetical protein HMPREF1986_00485 [Oribacterium sp. oral taxon 078 str. F0263]
MCPAFLWEASAESLSAGAKDGLLFGRQSVRSAAKIGSAPTL